MLLLISAMISAMIAVSNAGFCERPQPPSGIATGFAGFPPPPPPPPSREALRIHQAAHYGIGSSAGEPFNGKTLQVDWALSYNCSLLERALVELKVCAHEFTLKLECGPEVNAALYEEYQVWENVPHFAPLMPPYLAVPNAWVHISMEAAFKHGLCGGCKTTTTVWVQYVQ